MQDEKKVAMQSLEIPEHVIADAGSQDASRFCRFTFKSLGRGFGNTIGIALRRALLSSIEGVAIISFKLSEVTHEMQPIDGVTEDVTEIVLNLKTARLKLPSIDSVETFHTPKSFAMKVEVTQEELDAAGGSFSLTFGKIFNKSNLEVVNPSLHICTVNKPKVFDFVFRVGQGSGYVYAEEQTIENRLDNEIIIDAMFSPVEHVHYWVEPIRKDKSYDFDRLILEVTTDGRVTPAEALSISSKILQKHLELCDIEKIYIIDPSENSKDPTEGDIASTAKLLAQPVGELELSVRAANCLKDAHIGTVYELVVKAEAELLRYRNFGKKSLDEIKQVLSEMGLSLGLEAHMGRSMEVWKEHLIEQGLMTESETEEEIE